MAGLRVVVAVSRDRSDLYFANQLMRRLNVVGVLVENQVRETDGTPAWRKALRLLCRPDQLISRVWNSLLMRWHGRFAVYNRPGNLTDFGPQGLALDPVPGCDVMYTRGVNAVNAPEYVEWLRKLAPDVVAVCGASLIRRDFLSVPRCGVLNLHGGLAQRYRGLNTTDWAVHNGEPEYVGGTVHFVAPGIDDGDVVYQGRPLVDANDTPNTLYVKVVKLGVEMMEGAIRDLESGSIRTAALPQRGNLYLHKAFTTAVRRRTWRRCQQGVVRRYVTQRAERDRAVDAVIINEHPLSSGHARCTARQGASVA
jgi:folate-dependent phosphoribosylglycinamide formyltransferase PurN